MEFKYAFLANSAEVSTDGRFFVLGGGIDGISVAGFPAYLPALAVVASVHFSVEECGQEHQFRAALHLPDGTDLGAQASVPLRPTTLAEMPDTGPNLKVAIGLFGLGFPVGGTYSVNFYVGDRFIGELEFMVAEARPAKDCQGG